MRRERKPHGGTLAARQVVARLADDLDARGYRAKGRAHSAIGKQTSYFANLFKKPHGGARIPLENYIGLIDGCGMSPARQLARGLAPDDDPIQVVIADAERLAPSLDNMPAVLRDAPIHGRSELDRGRDDRLKARFDALQFVNPRRVAQRTASLLRNARGPRAVAQLLGLWSSAQRLLSRLDLASVGIGRALALSDLFELDDLTAELARRASVTMRDRGEIEWGLALARRAAAAYLEAGDLEQLGQTLVTCGALLANAGEHGEAERLSIAALGLTDSACHRFSAHQQIAQARALLGQFDAAERAAIRAADCAPPGLHISGRLSWLRGWIAAERSDFSASDRLLSEALDQLQTAPLDAVLVGAELVRVKTRAGNHAEARSLAVSLRIFAQELARDPLDTDRLLSAALDDLVKAGEEAHINEQRVDAIIARIEAARAARQTKLRDRLRP